MKRFALALTLMASTALAGGMDGHATAPDPCPPGLVTDGTLTGDMLANWQAVRAMSCPHQEPPRRAFFDRRTGERLTDDEILRRIFDGSDVTPVPVPAAGGFLAGAFAVLALFRRKDAQNPQPQKPRHVPAREARARIEARNRDRVHRILVEGQGREWRGRG